MASLYDECVDDPWRCDHCGFLQYNVLIGKDKKRYPVPGAPVPNELNQDYPYVCCLCLDLYRNLSDRSYWTRLHVEWKKSTQQIDRLRPGSEYLGT